MVCKHHLPFARLEIGSTAMVKRKNTYIDMPTNVQTGYGPVKFNVFRAYTPLNRQRGHGFGGLMRGWFRRSVPFLKKGLATVGKRALQAGSDVLEDVLVNKTPLKQAVKKRARSEANELVNVFKKSVGRGAAKRGRPNKKSINRANKAFPFISTSIPKSAGRRKPKEIYIDTL